MPGQPDAAESPASTETSAEPVTYDIERAVVRALEANRGLLYARDSLVRTRLSLDVARSEYAFRYVPVVSAGSSDDATTTSNSVGVDVSAQRRFRHGGRLSAGPSFRRAGGDYQAGVGIDFRQPLLRGSQVEYGTRGLIQAEYAERTTTRAFYIRQVEVVVSTVAAAFEVVRRREVLRFQEEFSGRAHHHLEATRARSRSGLSDPIDEFRADILVQQAEAGLAVAREAYRDAQDDLAVILDLPVDAAPEVVVPLDVVVAAIPEPEAMAIALDRRVEVWQIDDDIRLAAVLSRTARHAVLPDLDLVLSYDRIGRATDASGLGSLDQDAWSVNLASTTETSRIAELAALQQSQVDLEARIRDKDLELDRIQSQVRRELRALRKNEQRIVSLREQVRRAEGQQRLARLKFRHGLADNFDLVDAERVWSSAQTELVSARIDYILGEYRLRASLGTLLEIPPWLERAR